MGLAELLKSGSKAESDRTWRREEAMKDVGSSPKHRLSDLCCEGVQKYT